MGAGGCVCVWRVAETTWGGGSKKKCEWGRMLKNTKKTKERVKKGNVLEETPRFGFLFSKGGFECVWGVMEGGCRGGCERHNVQLQNLPSKPSYILGVFASTDFF